VAYSAIYIFMLAYELDFCSYIFYVKKVPKYLLYLDFGLYLYQEEGHSKLCVVYLLLFYWVVSLVLVLLVCFLLSFCSLFLFFFVLLFVICYRVSFSLVYSIVCCLSTLSLLALFTYSKVTLSLSISFFL